MKKTIKVKNIKETQTFAKKLSRSLNEHDIICLEGDLGTGKTVIAKEIAKNFNVNDFVISPTFNILKIYNTNSDTIKQILHFDLYRIKNTNELLNIGFDEYLSFDDSIIIIEWPDLAYELIEPPYIKININYDNKSSDSRIIQYERITQ